MHGTYEMYALHITVGGTTSRMRLLHIMLRYQRCIYCGTHIKCYIPGKGV